MIESHGWKNSPIKEWREFKRIFTWIPISNNRPTQERNPWLVKFRSLADQVPADECRRLNVLKVNPRRFGGSTKLTVCNMVAYEAVTVVSGIKSSRRRTMMLLSPIVPSFLLTPLYKVDWFQKFLFGSVHAELKDFGGETTLFRWRIRFIRNSDTSSYTGSSVWLWVRVDLRSVWNVWSLSVHSRNKLVVVAVTVTL